MAKVIKQFYSFLFLCFCYNYGPEQVREERVEWRRLSGGEREREVKTRVWEQVISGGEREGSKLGFGSK